MRTPNSSARVALGLAASLLLAAPVASQSQDDTVPRRSGGVMRPAETPEVGRPGAPPAVAPTQRTPERPAATPSGRPDAKKAEPGSAAPSLRPDAARSAPAGALGEAGDERSARQAVEQRVRQHQAEVERTAREFQGSSDRFARKQTDEIERENAKTLNRIRSLAKNSGRIEALRERVRTLEQEAAKASPERSDAIAKEADALLEEYEGLVGTR